MLSRKQSRKYSYYPFSLLPLLSTTNMSLNRKAWVVWKHTGRHGDSKASLLCDSVPRSPFWYFLLAALFMFTCDKCNIFSAAPDGSLSDFNKQASNRRGLVHKNLSSSPFITLMPAVKWDIISKSWELVSKLVWVTAEAAVIRRGCCRHHACYKPPAKGAGCCGWPGALLKPRLLWGWATVASGWEQELKLAHYNENTKRKPSANSFSVWS